MSRKSPAAPVSTPIPWWEWGVLGLLLARCYLPTEGTEQGLTLWLAAATWFLVGIRCWLGWRDEESVSWKKLDWNNLGMLLLVMGQLISGFHILWPGGDRHAAANVLWEWLSIGGMFLCLKRALRSPSFRGLIVPGLAGTTGVLAILGLWQCFYWYPLIIADAEQLSKLSANRANLSPDELRQLSQLEQRIPDFVDKDTTGQWLFLSRLRSAEPLGRFALANSFASVLVVGLLFLGTVIAGELRRQRAKQAMLLSMTGVVFCTILGSAILLCLIFTESRTALVGWIIGGATLGYLHWRMGRQQASQPRMSMVLIVSAVTLLVLTAAIAWVAYNPDVFQGPLLSLKYRAEYWNATGQLLRDHPIFGAGPGNFRPLYLQYKLPGSSEEIVDPHNLLLDAWASGGLVALCGLLIMLVQGGIALFSSEEVTGDTSPGTSVWARAIILTGPILFIIAGQAFLEGQPDTQLGWLLLPALGMSLLSVKGHADLRTAAAVAWVALTIHLCGAGGIGMPAIVQIWLLCWLLMQPVAGSAPTAAVSLQLWRDRLWIAGGVSSVLVMFACLWFAVLPVLAVTGLLDQSRQLQREGNPRRAESLLIRATEIDAWNPDPWQELTAHYMAEWRSSPAYHADDFAKAIATQEAAIERDPNAGKRYRILGEWWAMHFRATHEVESALKSIAAYERAAQLYPNYSAIHAELALIQAESGQDGSAAARRAIELDDLNDRAGHGDKVLQKDVRRRLEGITGAKLSK